MNAAFNGHRIAAYSGIAGHLCPHVAIKWYWWLLLAVLLFANGCAMPDKAKPEAIPEVVATTQQSTPAEEITEQVAHSSDPVYRL